MSPMPQINLGVDFLLHFLHCFFFFLNIIKKKIKHERNMKNTVNYKLRHFRRAMCPTAVTYQEVNFVSRKVISTAGFGLREITQHLK